MKFISLWLNYLRRTLFVNFPIEFFSFLFATLESRFHYFDKLVYFFLLFPLLLRLLPLLPITKWWAQFSPMELLKCFKMKNVSRQHTHIHTNNDWSRLWRFHSFSSCSLLNMKLFFLSFFPKMSSSHCVTNAAFYQDTDVLLNYADTHFTFITLPCRLDERKKFSHNFWHVNVCHQSQKFAIANAWKWWKTSHFKLEHIKQQNQTNTSNMNSWTLNDFTNAPTFFSFPSSFT